MTQHWREHKTLIPTSSLTTFFLQPVLDWTQQCSFYTSSVTPVSNRKQGRKQDKTHMHTRLTALCLGLPRWAGTRKEKPIWILLKQETVSGSGSGSGIRWAICKSAPRSSQITKPVPHHSVFYRLDALPVAQPTAWKHWRHRKQDKSFKKNKNLITPVTLPLKHISLICVSYDTVTKKSTQGTHVRIVENASSVVRPNDSKASVEAEIGRSDQLGGPAHLVPQRNLLVGNVPQTQFAIQRSTQKITIVLKYAGKLLNWL